jgi:hypothetical protein
MISKGNRRSPQQGNQRRPGRPAIKQRLSELGAIPIAGNATQFGAMLVTETERWRKVVEMSGHK